MPHEVADGSKPDYLESHVAVCVGSRRRIGGHTTYRPGLDLLSPPRSDTEEFSHEAAPPSVSFDAAIDKVVPTSSNKLQPANVRDVQLYF